MASESEAIRANGLRQNDQGSHLCHVEASSEAFNKGVAGFEEDPGNGYCGSRDMIFSTSMEDFGHPCSRDTRIGHQDVDIIPLNDIL